MCWQAGATGLTGSSHSSSVLFSWCCLFASESVALYHIMSKYYVTIVTIWHQFWDSAMNLKYKRQVLRITSAPSCLCLALENMAHGHIWIQCTLFSLPPLFALTSQHPPPWFHPPNISHRNALNHFNTWPNVPIHVWPCFSAMFFCIYVLPFSSLPHDFIDNKDRTNHQPTMAWQNVGLCCGHLSTENLLAPPTCLLAPAPWLHGSQRQNQLPTHHGLHHLPMACHTESATNTRQHTDDKSWCRQWALRNMVANEGRNSLRRNLWTSRVVGMILQCFKHPWLTIRWLRRSSNVLSLRVLGTYSSMYISKYFKITIYMNALSMYVNNTSKANSVLIEA